MFEQSIQQLLEEFVLCYGEKLTDIQFTDMHSGTKRITIQTTNNALFIGKNGRTLKHIDTIIHAFLKTNNIQQRTQFNVGDYRESQETRIKKYAIDRAEYVSKTGKIFVFEPMNSYERRIVHTAINESVYGILVKTESIGEGKDRHTILRSK